MKFDPKTQVVVYREAAENDTVVTHGGDIHPAVRWPDIKDHRAMCVEPRRHDFAWLLEESRKNPLKEYRGTNGYLYRWNGGRLEYLSGCAWVGVFVTIDILAATFEEDEEAAPKEGSPEWFAELPEGTCCWIGESRESYAKRVGKLGYDWFCVRNGILQVRVAETGITTWSLCLHNGERAEPKVGSQFWANMLQQQGVAVHHETMMSENARIVRGEYIDRNSGTALPGWFTSPLYRVGWSIWEAPTVSPAKQALAEIDEHRKAVAEIVERLKSEGKAS